MSKFLREPPSVRLAASVIVTATVVIVVARRRGDARRSTTRNTASVWFGMWWVLQTVTTVGYGDLTPTQAIGQAPHAVVMLWGVAFLAIITAAITSVFVARAQRSGPGGDAASRRRPRRVDRSSPAHRGSTSIDAQLQQLSRAARAVDAGVPSAAPRRASSASPSVAATVTHELHRLAAAELRLAARARRHVHRHLLETQPGVDDADQRLDLGRAARVRLGEERQRLRVHGVEAARRVAERPAQHDAHRAAQQAGAETPRRARPVAVRRVAVPGHEAGADRDVALVRARPARAAAAAPPRGCWPSASTRPQNA